MNRAALALYRMRGPLYYAAAFILIGNVLVTRVAPQASFGQIRTVVVYIALAVAAICALLTFAIPRRLPEQRARVVRAPVHGRWLGLNSPASKVPSHGVRIYGQAYAIDIVYEPAGARRPAFGGPMMRASGEYPAFGQPVFAMIDGTVVRASGWRRDHRARSNRFGFFYLLVEGVIREIGGPGFVVGNHVTIRSDDGVYATAAHLRRGSITVGIGDRVTAGTRIASCGNSGNSSEPHVHAQLTDRASFWTAQGLPMAFAGIALGEDAERVDALPANGEHMTAGPGREMPTR